MSYLKYHISKLWPQSFKFTRGATIVEMLIYMVMLVSFMLVLSNIFISSIDVQLESEAQSEVTQDGRYLLARISNDIRRAQDIVIPSAPGVQSSSLETSISGVSNIYSLNSGNLEITNSNGTDRLNSYGSNVSNLSFERVGNVGGKNTVRITFTLTSKTSRSGAGPEIKNFQTTVGLR